MSGICREYGPGEPILCPKPDTSGRGFCGCRLQDVGQGSQARACIGEDVRPEHPYTEKLCKWCKSMVLIEVWRSESQSAA